MAIIEIVVLDFSLVEGLAVKAELVFLLESSHVANDSLGGLLLEVELLSAGSSACSVLHDFLLLVHLADQLRSLGLAFGVDLSLQLACVQVLVQLSFLSLKVSNDGVSGTGLLFVVGIVSDGRHGGFLLMKFFVYKDNKVGNI